MDDNATISSNTMTQACKETVSPEPEFVKENYPLSVSDKPMETKVMQIFDPSVWTESWSWSWSWSWCRWPTGTAR